MKGHFSHQGTQIENFKVLINTINTKNGIRELNEAWNRAGKDGKITLVPDSAIVTQRVLISNIDAAFEAWESVPWKEKINFSTFCNYILPYRCSGEHIGENWRKAMKYAYAHVIVEETDLLSAFAKIKKAVYNNVILSNAYCPYELDAITIHKIGKAECGQRAIVPVDALRALGIPSAIDFTPIWADYSHKSHGWVSSIGIDDITYTVFEDDSIAKSLNPVDASILIPRYNVTEEDHCPYKIKQIKTPVKIYREEFALVDSTAIFKQGFLSNGFLRDASGGYGLTSNIILETDTDKEINLCGYVSAQDWMPVACVKPVNGMAVFNNVGKNSVCTAYIIENGKRRYISCPFLVGNNGIERFYHADVVNKTEIRINRKYPLCQNIADVWGYMRGGVFLGSNDPDFINEDTLAVIKTMPYGMTNAKSLSDKKYRFLRYKAPYNNRSSLSELQFLCNDTDDTVKKIKGSYTANGVDVSHLEYLCDDNTATSCRGQNTGFTITIDLGEGKTSRVDNIMYAPSTDLNFVEKGHLYELYYFDKSWKIIGRQIAQEELLLFKDVPSDAILLLKDKTAGQEERIFEYKNGVQIWH